MGFLITQLPVLMACQVSSLPLRFPNPFSGFFHEEILLSVPTLLICIEIYRVILPGANVFYGDPLGREKRESSVFGPAKVWCTAAEL